MLHSKADNVADSMSIWNLLPYFTNLESLELHGSFNPLDNGNSGLSLSNARPLANLKFAKLFAYIPRNVAAYILRSNDSLECLELGMLDDPKPGDPGIDSGDNVNFVEQVDYQGGVIPRPLGGFFSDSSPSFRKLKHLHLCQPCNSRGDYFNQRNAWSAYTEQTSLQSFTNILRASCETLDTLVLDQRPGAGVEDNEGFSEDEFLNTGLTGQGNKVLAKTLENMIADMSELPKLKQVYLYGVIVSSRLRRGTSEETPGDKLLDGLERRGVKCEAMRGRWCLFDQESGKTTWARWDGDGCTNVHDEYLGIRWYTVLAKV
ncbi:hypothetical protein FLONG3_6499 [Fusarium longipes]|uniref:Uncharacterized protein n=1 Tax=Fusarium longipes TaxID=694270 RepID=A0A395SL59_9HYPO|nr:hypothetical protein FLONG3_6499 [Fusarium longipes]